MPLLHESDGLDRSVPTWYLKSKREAVVGSTAFQYLIDTSGGSTAPGQIPDSRQDNAQGR
jgi:hypothetical protein